VLLLPSMSGLKSEGLSVSTQELGVDVGVFVSIDVGIEVVLLVVVITGTDVGIDFFIVGVDIGFKVGITIAKTSTVIIEGNEPTRVLSAVSHRLPDLKNRFQKDNGAEEANRANGWCLGEGHADGADGALFSII